MSIYITGLGILGIFGKGKEAIINAINNKQTTENYDSLDVDLKSIKDKGLAKQIRRADRFTKMSVYSAAEAIKDAGLENLDLENAGIILTTGFGPHNTTFEFLDELITYGEKNVSPIKFSHSVHNAAASYVSQLFRIKGPISTITQFKFPVQRALQLAECWLKTDLCENILLCCIDERGTIYNQAFNEVLNVSSNNKLNPQDFSNNAKAVPCEGCISFILSKNNSDLKSYCQIKNIEFNTSKHDNKYFTILNADGIPTDQSYYKTLPNSNNVVFAPYYGSIVTGTSFDIAIAALLLNNELSISNLINLTEHINCFKYNCSGEFSNIIIKKQ